MIVPDRFLRAGTHVPVLRFLGQLMDFRSITEFGCGIYSTLTFLNQKYFPNLQNLYSYETSSAWIKKLKKITHDKRLHLIHLNREKPHWNRRDWHAADLVFVDGKSEHRNDIMSNLQYLSPLFVIHDVFHYKRGFRKFKFRYIYQLPYMGRKANRITTGIASNEIDVSAIDWKITWEVDWYNLRTK